jgi:hypothetical protein
VTVSIGIAVGINAVGGPGNGCQLTVLLSLLRLGYGIWSTVVYCVGAFLLVVITVVTGEFEI